MKLAPLIIFLFSVEMGYAQSLGHQDSIATLLPNGWKLSPAGKQVGLGDLPLNLAVSPDGALLAVTNNGESDQSIQLIESATGKVLDTKPIGKSWLGLCFTGDSRGLFASAGNDNFVLRYRIEHEQLQESDTLFLGPKWPKKISPAGLAVDKAGTRLYVVTKEDSALYILDIPEKKILRRLGLPAEPYTCLLNEYSSELYVSVWGGKMVNILNTQTMEFKDAMQTGGNPNDICVDVNRAILYVANANDNSVSVIDLRRKIVIETLDAALYPRSLSGSTTNSVALTQDGKTLYIANADNNCLAVFDVSRPGNSYSKGFIPVGWYPTCVRVLKDQIYVTNGKGLISKANPHGPNPYRPREKTSYKMGDHSMPEEYIGGMLKGALSIIPVPDKRQLALWSQQVYKNCPYSTKEWVEKQTEASNPIPEKLGGKSPIKYVFYVLKENRTYDQVLGDLPNGNGDTSLVLFGKRITPNQHMLASNFVLLDNFYVDGEVSADGHNWSMAAYANDYVEKTWPTSYGGRGGAYDYSGNRSIALPPGGFIWDDCLRHRVSLRNYGEFADDGKVPLKDLDQHTCYAFPHWDLRIQDIAREKAWERDFDSISNQGKVPAFNIVYFGNDHTSGLGEGAYSPFAAVADNDLAVGRFVEHLSKSPIWKESAIFILEDDAQDGADHVDAHRSTAYIVSPFVKRNFVDHTMYTTSSMLKTMELILRIPPMTQYDAAANAMWRCFTGKADASPVLAVPAEYDINEKNGKELSGASLPEFDLSKEDRVPMEIFNRILWNYVKGPDRPYPGSKRSAFVKVREEEED